MFHRLEEFQWQIPFLFVRLPRVSLLTFKVAGNYTINLRWRDKASSQRAEVKNSAHCVNHDNVRLSHEGEMFSVKHINSTAGFSY